MYCRFATSHPGISLSIFIAALLLAGCGPSTSLPTAQPITSSPAAPAPQPSPTLTPFPTLASYPTATLTPFPGDVFDDFQQAAGSCRLRAAYGQVSPGESVEETALVDSTIGHVWFSLSWREGDLDLVLIQPDGTVIDPSAIQGDPANAGFASEPDHKEYSLSAPQPGTWRAGISAKSVPASGSPYELEVRVSDATMVSIDFDRQEYFPGDLMKLSASIEDSRSPAPAGPEYIYGVTMQVVVEDPQQKQTSFELYDDGLHGDGAGHDGLYANAFSATALAGNYRFYFHISGVNNRAGEPFTRECFLGETVKPIPTPTATLPADSRACQGTITASEPVVVRPEGAGGTKRSEFGRYASGLRAASTSAGILVTWNVGFNGQSPEPNSFARLLDDHGSPAGEMEPLFERSVDSLSPSLVSTDGGAAMIYCGLYGTRTGLTSALLDAQGRLISERTLAWDCAAPRAATVWTGSRLMSAWTSPVYTPQGYTTDVLLDVADASGKSLSTQTVRTDGDGDPHFGTGHGRVLLVTGTRTGLDLTKGDPGRTHAAIHRFDLQGDELGDALILDAVPFDREGQTILGQLATPFIVPTPEGWLFVASSKDSWLYVARLAPDGTLASGPVVLQTDFDFPNGFDDVIPYGDGAVVQSGGLLLFLSADGVIRQTWHPGPSEIPASASLVVHKGRLFMAYSSQSTGRPYTNQLMIRELQCVP